MEKMKVFCKYIRDLAMKAMLYEVSTTPKPGLVDRKDPGAHRDMDFFTFLDSSIALGDTFYDCALEGCKYKDKDYRGLLGAIRPLGVTGEKCMFHATGGINTHKGLVFSLGIIAAAAGSLYKEKWHNKIDSGVLIDRVKDMTRGLTAGDFKDIETKQVLTYGEKLYKKHGITGIRGEVEAGFPTVVNIALPRFKVYMEEGTQSINDILVQVLLHLMAETEDSNVLGRHHLETLTYVRQAAQKVLDLGGIFTEEGKKAIVDINKDFIEKNISPGGSADLLAVTFMLYALENPK